MVSGFEMRVGDAERDAVAALLREHFASGRLTQDELNERLDQALAARTRGDLHTVMTDLPSAQPGWAAAGAASSGVPVGGYDQTGGARGGRSRGAGWQHEARRSAGTLVTSFVLLSALLTLGILGIFGLGAGRPFGIVLIFAAFALLRRLIFGIFRRRRGGRGGSRRRC